MNPGCPFLSKWKRLDADDSAMDANDSATRTPKLRETSRSSCPADFGAELPPGAKPAEPSLLSRGRPDARERGE